MKTAGRWPWKSESSKKCVTTYLPNGLAPKIDSAEAYNRNSAVQFVRMKKINQIIMMTERVNVRDGDRKGPG